MNLYFALVADIRFLHEARFYPLIRWPKLFDHYRLFPLVKRNIRKQGV